MIMIHDKKNNIERDHNNKTLSRCKDLFMTKKRETLKKKFFTKIIHFWDYMVFNPICGRVENIR